MGGRNSRPVERSAAKDHAQNVEPCAEEMPPSVGAPAEAVLPTPHALPQQDGQELARRADLSNWNVDSRSLADLRNTRADPLDQTTDTSAAPSSIAAATTTPTTATVAAVPTPDEPTRAEEQPNAEPPSPSTQRNEAQARFQAKHASRSPALFRIKGHRALIPFEVALAPGAEVTLRHDETYVLDAVGTLFVWIGAEAGPLHQTKSKAMAIDLRDLEYSGHADLITLYPSKGEADPNAMNPAMAEYAQAQAEGLSTFLRVLHAAGCRTQIEASAQELADEAFEAQALAQTSLEQVSCDEHGSVVQLPVARGRHLTRELLRDDGVYLLTSGNELFLWRGRRSSHADRDAADGLLQRRLAEDARRVSRKPWRAGQGTETVLFIHKFHRWDLGIDLGKAPLRNPPPLTSLALRSRVATGNSVIPARPAAFEHVREPSEPHRPAPQELLTWPELLQLLSPDSQPHPDLNDIPYLLAPGEFEAEMGLTPAAFVALPRFQQLRMLQARAPAYDAVGVEGAQQHRRGTSAT